MTLTNCLCCGTEIKTFPSRIGRKKYCSVHCRSVSNVNAHFKMGHPGYNNAFNGKNRRHSGGYIEIYSPKHPHRSIRNSVLEHRLIMEKSIGRYLKTEEVVHHINDKRNDNRIENLILFSNQSEHAKFHQQRNRTTKKSSN